MRRWLAVLLLVACGGEETSARDAAPIDAAVGDATLTAGCAVTLSGAVTGTYGCTVTAGKNGEEIFSVFGLSAGEGALTALVLTARIEGTLAVGDHLGDVTSAAASITVGNESFVATKGSDNDIGSIGTLKITSLGPQLPPGGGATVWAPHGTVTAMLVSVTTPDQRVSLSATF